MRNGNRVSVWLTYARAARVRRTVWVATAVEHLGDRVPERQHERAPVVEGVVERKDRRFLAAVISLRGREGSNHLVDQLSLLPQLPGLVEKHLQLRCHIAESCRR